MLPATHNVAARSLRLAAILSAIAVAAPAIAHGQAGDRERALLNQIENPAAATMPLSVRSAVDDSILQGPMDGQRALAGRGPAAAFAHGTFDAVIARHFTRAWISGTRALMGRE
jgi:hypothetical protein